MINIVLYDNNAVLRIAEKIIAYFSPHNEIVANGDIIWLHGAYFRFKPEMITFNIVDEAFISSVQVFDCLSYILKNEEVFITNSKNRKLYIERVEHTTNFEQLLGAEVIQ